MDRLLKVLPFNLPTSNPYILFGTCILLPYVTLVQSLRWRRYNELHRKYQAKFENKTLTPEEAQRVLQVSSAYDMPLLLNYALAFALFKTYGIVGSFFQLFRGRFYLEFAGTPPTSMGLQILCPVILNFLFDGFRDHCLSETLVLI